ncbi:hypothetical protein DCS_05771 [Drechmeria coniospora]|uniref:Uncharacterized protein n=1 Tax=Drechmeria coniospora TaxID=98403 RepID=A0A151GNR4_DRECN|nr:hypothetical protein DCS_05771 [Drechmeria coniospora]KYK58753.1 hypothetical protein DCS_05771 [Drechmeria coniospora]
MAYSPPPLRRREHASRRGQDLYDDAYLAAASRAPRRDRSERHPPRGRSERQPLREPPPREPPPRDRSERHPREHPPREPPTARLAPTATSSTPSGSARRTASVVGPKPTTGGDDTTRRRGTRVLTRPPAGAMRRPIRGLAGGKRTGRATAATTGDARRPTAAMTGDAPGARGGPLPQRRRRGSMPATVVKKGASWLANPLVQAGARTAFAAGAQAVMRSRNDPSPWLGAKGAKVATAALGAALVDGLVNQKHPAGAKQDLVRSGVAALLGELGAKDDGRRHGHGHGPSRRRKD